MCGIAGWVGGGNLQDRARNVHRMMETLAQRGPDSEGMKSWPLATLGHRRLAILDLSPAGHQPMCALNGEMGVVFNGCIYNFLQLRSELESAGRVFRSRCDTEVLVEGYLAWGLDQLVSRLRGMFAFALWDNRNETLFLVRDRLGVKPLHFAERNGQLVFASTAAAIAASGWSRDLNPAAVLEYFEFGYIGERNSIYSGLRKVQPGAIVEWKAGQWSEREYWRLPEPSAQSRAWTFEEAVAETERLLLESVRLRLEADVPVGALLSGGIDSSLVCWALRELEAGVTAFTVATPGDRHDESAAAAVTARRIGIEHRIVDMPPEGDELLDQLSSAYGEPLGCSSALAMLRVSEAIRPYATVLLTGDGGDDIFLGYPYHRTYFLAQTWANRIPDFMAPLWRTLRPLADAVPALRRPKHLADYITGGIGAVTRVHDGLPYYEDRGMLGPRLRELSLPQRQIPLDIRSGRRLLFDALAYERYMQFNGEFLTKVDGGTMAHALEARSPFLDQCIWEFAAQLTPDIRLARGKLKAILRELARRKLGAEIADRPKQGFTIPAWRWVTGTWRPCLDRIASGSLLEKQGWIATGSLKPAVEEAIRKGGASQQLWFLVALEHWLNLHTSS